MAAGVVRDEEQPERMELLCRSSSTRGCTWSSTARSPLRTPRPSATPRRPTASAPRTERDRLNPSSPLWKGTRVRRGRLPPPKALRPGV